MKLNRLVGIVINVIKNKTFRGVNDAKVVLTAYYWRWRYNTKMRTYQLHHKNLQIQQLNVRAGATVAHIHVRDPETGGVSHDPELYAETVRLIREADEDIVINVTSGGGGDFIPSLEHPETGGEGTWIQTPEERFKPIGDLLPEMCTLDCGSVNMGDAIYLSPASWLRKQAQMVKDAESNLSLNVLIQVM